VGFLKTLYIWKNDKKYYARIHKWAQRKLNRLDKCQKCGERESRMCWHNLSGEYKKIITDWIYICPSCHRKEHNMNGIFKKGYDSRRSLKGLKKGQQILSEITKTQYFNRFNNEWVNII